LSNKPRILITGASGLVGSYLLRLEDLKIYDVYCTVHNEPVKTGTPIATDFQGSLESMAESIAKVRPDIIINLAAMTNVDLCESKREAASRINHLLVRQLARYIMVNKDSFLIHVSTDYVFDGERGQYKEEDSVNPINWYGMTKLFAERELVEHCNSENWCIARTSTPFGLHSKKESFPLFVIRKLRSRQEVRALVDQTTSPTYALNLAEMLLDIADRRETGIYHTAGSSQMTRYEQALEVARICNLDPGMIKKSYTEEMKWNARRPRNSSLDVIKAETRLSKKPMNFKSGMSLFALELGKNH
jgi:dTDP-4-dehydrorhamnose reductase